MLARVKELEQEVAELQQAKQVAEDAAASARRIRELPTVAPDPDVQAK